MAIFTVTTNAEVNKVATRLGDITLTLDYNELHTFTVAEFTTATNPTYQDPEGDALESIEVTTLPTQGTLELNAVPVIALDEITAADITSNLLTYQADPGDTDGYSNSTMTFDVKDIGSSLFASLSGVISFTVEAEINLPPSAVGDNSLTTDYGDSIVFTTANFTTETTPAYADPEADAAECLQVLTLPTTGTLKINAVDVVLNEEILFSDITSGLFTFVPDNDNTNSYMVTFDFQIKDAGSGLYTS